MNEVEKLQALTSTVARLEAEVRRMNSATDGASSLVHARRGQRLALWLGAIGLCSLPVLGWAAVRLTEFQAGDPIVAADVNTNFSNINAALDGVPQFGEAIFDTDDESNGVPAPILNATIEITTMGGPVEIRLIPLSVDALVESAPSAITLQGEAGTGVELSGEVLLERYDGAMWQERARVRLQGANLQGLVALPPSVARSSTSQTLKHLAVPAHRTEVCESRGIFTFATYGSWPASSRRRRSDRSVTA
ncbi:MAG: hypothetical protein U0168_03945 [Nannocystaceae bacterium]